MKNGRFILFFLVGIAVCAIGLWSLSMRARFVASAATQRVLCPIDSASVEALSIRRGNKLVTLERNVKGEWRMKRPYPAAADNAPISRLIDMLTLSPVNDMRTEDELLRLGEGLADFGLKPPRATVEMSANGRTNTISFGSETASGKEVYVRVEGLMNVFTLPIDAYEAIPSDADAFRPRTVLSSVRDDISGIEFRVPEAPFVKLVREGATWRLSAPLEAPADQATVTVLADRLAAARVMDFTLPSVTQPPPAGTTPEGALPAAALAPYGLAADAALTLTVRTSDGGSETILFGGVAGTNRVWALVRNGSAVVTVEAALAELCRSREAAFRDTRVFTFAADETLKSVSLTAGSLVYVLGRDSNGLWRLDAPVVAPADQTTAAALVELVLKLKQSDIEAVGTATNSPMVRVAVTTASSSKAGVSVPLSFFGPAAAFADLRSKTLLTLDPSTVQRLEVIRPKGRTITVSYDATRAKWHLEKPIEGRRANSGAIKTMLTALANVEAVSVETAAATPNDYKRCGLDAPTCTIAIDMDGTDSVRRNILLGGTASGGGRYATVGGADAVFIVSRQTATALLADITE